VVVEADARAFVIDVVSGLGGSASLVAQDFVQIIQKPKEQ